MLVVVELPPTWTPTPYVEPTPELPTATPLPPVATNTPIPALPTDTPIPAQPTEEPTPEPPPTDTPVPVAKPLSTAIKRIYAAGPAQPTTEPVLYARAMNLSSSARIQRRLVADSGEWPTRLDF